MALAQRHYTWREGRRKWLAVGPGEKMVLVTADGLAAWAWRRFIDDSQAVQGVCCSFFRNEGPVLSSLLVREASELAWVRWPGRRLYTHVNPSAIRSVNPGACYRAAGWRVCGWTGRRRLITLEVRAAA